MQLRLKELQNLVKETKKEERTHCSLRSELYKVLGPSILVSEKSERIAEASNEQLDILEASGRFVDRSAAKLSVLIESSNSRSHQIRKIAARLLPEKFISKMIFDESSSVRCAAASRLPYGIAKEALKKYPDDDQLKTIVKSKRLQESGIATPRVQDEHFDLYGENPLGDLIRTQSPLKELPDTWYERLAQRLCKEYGTNIEGQWEEILASRVASSYYATSGIKLDKDKLLKSIYKYLEERDRLVVSEVSLKSIARKLREESLLNEVAALPDAESVDPIDVLTNENFSSAQYVENAEKIFDIKKSSIPSGIKKYRLGEGFNKTTLVPTKGFIPERILTSRTENALNKYVDSWNKIQNMTGEPYKLSWYPHPASSGSVGFKLELK